MSLSLLERALMVASSGPRRAAMVHDGVVSIAFGPLEIRRTNEPREALQCFSAAIDDWATPGAGSEPCAFGWIAYDGLRDDEPGSTRDARRRGDAAPVAWIARYEAILDVPLDGSMVRPRSSDPVARERIAAEWELSAQRAETFDRTPWEVHSATERSMHAAAIACVREAIRDGEVYLVNVARMLHVRHAVSVSSMCARIAASRAPRAAFIDAGDVQLGGMSMELALAWDRTTGTLESGPIKGTRPRDVDPVEDARLARELASDPKERAENVMAVDVHRNDLGRVAAGGSVSVPRLCVAEAHAYVHHLVSTVRARVDPRRSTREVLASMLPVGSVTGAPKRSAMAMIARVEKERRGVYTGAYGTIGGDGSLHLAVAIRTMVRDAAGLHYGSGGGIVFDSDPDREWNELAWKERTLAGATRAGA